LLAAGLNHYNTSGFLQVLLTPDQDLSAFHMKAMSGLLGVCNRDLHPEALQYLEAALREDIQHLWMQLVTILLRNLWTYKGKV